MRATKAKKRMPVGIAAACALALVLAGCGIRVPADPNGTLDRVTDGILRVGVSHHPPWTDTAGTGDPTGTEVVLVEQLAEQLDADIAWTENSEAPLLEALHQGDLDLVIAGFTDDTPWAEKGAVTTPYTEATDPHGNRKKHVWIAPMGENAFLVSVERFLLTGEAER